MKCFQGNLGEPGSGGNVLHLVVMAGFIHARAGWSALLLL